MPNTRPGRAHFAHVPGFRAQASQKPEQVVEQTSAQDPVMAATTVVRHGGECVLELESE